jgi:hypothetical protein
MGTYQRPNDNRKILLKVHKNNNNPGLCSIHDADDGDKEVLYEQLQKTVDETPKQDAMLIVGDL